MTQKVAVKQLRISNANNNSVLKLNNYTAWKLNIKPINALKFNNSIAIKLNDCIELELISFPIMIFTQEINAL